MQYLQFFSEKNQSFEYLKNGFWSRFIETHQVMTYVNSRLKPPAKERRDEHRPWMWPLGIKVNFAKLILITTFYELYYLYL